MVDQDRVRTWAARLAAPAAFFAAAFVLVLIVQAATSSNSPGDATPPVQSGPSETQPTGPTTTQRGKKKFYRVRRGDTLESIAARNDTTVDALLTLNPGIDPLELSPGQRIRVA